MVKVTRPSLRVIDFVDDLRLVEEDGSRGRLFVIMARMLELIARMGAHYHTREGRRWWPTRSTPWRGFVVNTERGVVEIDSGKRRKGAALCDAIVAYQVYPFGSGGPFYGVPPELSSADCAGGSRSFL